MWRGVIVKMKIYLEALFEAIKDLGLVYIVGMYASVIFSGLSGAIAPRGFVFLGLIFTLNIFCYSYSMKRYMQTRDYYSLLYTLIWFLLPTLILLRLLFY